MDTRAAAHELLERPQAPVSLKFGTAIACVAAAAALAWLPAYAGLPDAGRAGLFILAAGAGLWITESMPAFAVALVVIGLEIAILGRPGGVFAKTPADWEIFVRPWASPLFWLFFGGMVLAQGTSKTGLDQYLARRVLASVGGGRRSLLAGFMGISFVFSMILSNTATASMMLLLVAPILRSLDRKDAFGMALVLGIVVSTNLGGMATLIGTPPNAIAAGALERPIGFARWLVLGLPVGLVLVVAMFAYLNRRYRVGGALDFALPSADTGEGSWERKIVAGTLVVTVALWLTAPLHGIPIAVVSFVPPCALAALGVLKADDMRAIPWDVLILLAGGLSLGVTVEVTGLAAWLASAFELSALHPAVLALCLGYATMLVSNVMSNTAAASIAIPMGIALAGAGREAMIAASIALSASAAMCLPISSPPNALAHSSGRLAARDLLAAGSLAALLAPPLAVGWAWLTLG